MKLHLSGAPLLSRLLALPKTIRLGWKCLPGTVNYGQNFFTRVTPNVSRIEKLSTLETKKKSFLDSNRLKVSPLNSYQVSLMFACKA